MFLYVLPGAMFEQAAFDVTEAGTKLQVHLK